MRPGWKVLSSEWVPANLDLADRLEIGAGTALFQLRRLRLADHEPIGYHIAHAIPRLGESLDPKGFDQGGSLNYLQRQGQLEQSYANRTIEAVLATREISRLLFVEEGTPLLMIRRLVFDGDGQKVEDMQAVYRGDRFQYQVSQWPLVEDRVMVSKND
jgi:GntR family transcriptional regulator